MKKLLLLFFLVQCLGVWHAMAQTVITGKVTATGDNSPLPGVTVKIKGSTTGTQTDATGSYSIKATSGQVLVYSFVGFVSQERTVGNDNTISVALSEQARSLDAVEITALGLQAKRRSLGTSQQTVKGTDIAGTQRENFINALQGRVAGVEVTSSSGVPGASTSITIRGVSSISGSNQPLFVVDGLPIDNKTLSSNVFVSDAPGAASPFSNRGVDFPNRASDINPEDIESLVVLKGPEAAALYGIDAGNGAIVITTKRGKNGESRIEYSNSFRMEVLRKQPEIQEIYGIGTNGSGNVLTSLSSGGYQYFGPAYPAGTKFYDNIGNFFQTGFTQKHNVAISGGTDKMNYRVASSYTNQNGVVPNSAYDRLNITGSSQGTVNKWLKADLSMSYDYSNANMPFKGNAGPLISLLTWPRTDDAQNYLNPSGTRRTLGLISTLGTSELDNPYFSVNKNVNSSKTNHVLSNIGLTVTPAKWLDIQTRIGIDAYVSQNVLLRHPESSVGFSRGGTLDVANDITRNFNMQNLINLKAQKITKDFTIDATLGNSLQDAKSNVDAGYVENFLDPNFVSLNNGAPGSKSARTTITQRRLVSFFSRATLSFRDYLFLTGTVRNDRTSTIPENRYSFWYPSVSGSFVFTDAFKGLQSIFTSGKLRAAYAAVGKDARPYSYASFYESKTTVGGGYGYGFTGPNPDLKPEFAKSAEIGAELSFLNGRLGLDVTAYRKTTTGQIVNDLRFSYATGFILFNRNGASTRNKGLEITLTGVPIQSKNFNWKVIGNFAADQGIVTALPAGVNEAYVSDTNLYPTGSLRNGVTVGGSTRSLTGFFYQRNNNGDLLINPATGIPLRSTGNINTGYDRTPDYSIGLTNAFTYKNVSLQFLLDIRKGGAVFNGTEHYLTILGLSTQTLDRNTPRIISGVLQDGRENSASPTRNNIVITPVTQNSYYTSMSEELFIQPSINWVRLRDVTLSYRMPDRWVRRQNFVKAASVFVTGTDLFLITNYKGLDPVVSGNTAAVGGSGAQGIDFGNFPIPVGVNFGVKVTL